MKIKSEEFRMDKFQCYWMMLLHHATWLAWFLALLVGVLIIGGFIISPWVGIVAIGIAAFIAVMAMSFVIFAYGFYSVTGLNLAPHTLVAGEEGIGIDFPEGEQLKIRKEEIKSYYIYPGGVLLPVEGPKAGWIWVPPSAFDSPESFHSFLKVLYNRQENESNTE